MRFLPFMFLLGCSSVSTNYDYDMSYDFAKLKSYRWAEIASRAESNPLVVQRVSAAVDAQLKAKGYTPAGGQADFLLMAHVGRQDRIQVTDWGWGYGPRAAWYGGGVDVYQYEEGSLIVDVADARTQQLVWRGSATSIIDPNATPEERTERINEAVAKMFEEFPPEKK